MEKSSILSVAQLFSDAIVDIIRRSCQIEINVAKTAQYIASVQLSDDIGSFVSFNGDYDGMMVLNFQSQAALELVAASLRMMGMPEDEIPSHHMSDEVRSSIGELTNHIIGRARTNVQDKFDLIAHASIPAVVSVAKPIGLVFKSLTGPHLNSLRLSFRTPSNHRFYMEMTMEHALFAPLNPGLPPENPA